MLIFRLDPEPGTENDPRWKVPKGGPKTFWVRAASEDEARQRIDNITYAIGDFTGEKIQPSPWLDRKLSLCAQNDEMAPPEGVAIDGGGHTYDVPFLK